MEDRLVICRRKDTHVNLIVVFTFELVKQLQRLPASSAQINADDPVQTMSPVQETA